MRHLVFSLLVLQLTASAFAKPTFTTDDLFSLPSALAGQCHLLLYGMPSVTNAPTHTSLRTDPRNPRGPSKWVDEQAPLLMSVWVRVDGQSLGWLTEHSMLPVILTHGDHVLSLEIEGTVSHVPFSANGPLLPLIVTNTFLPSSDESAGASEAPVEALDADHGLIGDFLTSRKNQSDEDGDRKKPKTAARLRRESMARSSGEVRKPTPPQQALVFSMDPLEAEYLVSSSLDQDDRYLTAVTPLDEMTDSKRMTASQGASRQTMELSYLQTPYVGPLVAMVSWSHSDEHKDCALYRLDLAGDRMILTIQQPELIDDRVPGRAEFPVSAMKTITSWPDNPNRLVVEALDAQGRELVFSLFPQKHELSVWMAIRTLPVEAPRWNAVRDGLIRFARRHQIAWRPYHHTTLDASNVRRVARKKTDWQPVWPLDD